MNEVYKQYWGHIKPSRTYAIMVFRDNSVVLADVIGLRCFVVKQLPMNADIEIECVAATLYVNRRSFCACKALTTHLGDPSFNLLGHQSLSTCNDCLCRQFVC